MRMKIKVRLFSPLIFFLLSVSIAHSLSGFSVKIVTQDNWQLNAVLSNPENEKDFFLLVHSQKGSHENYLPFMRLLEKKEYGYLALDLRGHGKSLVSPESSTSTYKNFDMEGSDNQYNKMVRDLEAAVNFLSELGVEKKRIVLMGAVLGANLVVKAAALHPEIGKVAVLSLTFNIYGVHSVNPLKALGERPLLLVSSSNNYRRYKEFQILHLATKLNCSGRNVTSVVRERGAGEELLTSAVMNKILTWVENPVLPETREYFPPDASEKRKERISIYDNFFEDEITEGDDENFLPFEDEGQIQDEDGDKYE